MSSLFLGVRLTSNDYKRVVIDNVDLDCKVELFKDKVTDHIGTLKDSIELIYCGIKLDDDKSLASCGVKPGVMVHVLKKKTPSKPAKPKTLFDKFVQIQQLVVAFRALTLSPGYRAALQRLSRPEVLETIKAATPGLADDPVAIAMIQDPELIVQLSDIETVKKIAEHHPSLIYAAHHIAAHVHEETVSANTAQAGTSTGYSYSLEALSDDDDMESTSDQPRETNSLTRNTSYGAITAAQLADAILTSQNTYFGSQTNPVLPTPTLPNPSGVQSQPSTPNPLHNNLITNEMFSNAIQQAIASAPANTSNTTSQPLTGSQLPVETAETTRIRLQPQLQQMREMGLTNELLNLRALQVTSGDVQAAIELVFNGVIE